MSALIALLALSRFSLSGVVVECSASGATEQHQLGSGTVTSDPGHDHRATDEKSGDGDCGRAQHDSCLSMSSCANAVLSAAWVHAPDTCVAQRVIVDVSDRVFELSRGPEPPPPRS